MGSKTPENEGRRNHEPAATSNKSCSVGGEPRGQHLARDGDANLGDGGDDDEASEADLASTPLKSMPLLDSTKKKKRKRSKKKKLPSQSSPPRVALDRLFPSGEYRSGQVISRGAVDENLARVTGSEARLWSRHHLEDGAVLNDYRKAAEVHRQVRQWVQQNVGPGQSLASIATEIEDGVRALLGNDGKAVGHGLEAGMGFPTGLSLNHCVAHYTPNPGQKDIFVQQQDVLKVDFGVHINGWIVDSAFTMTFDSRYDDLLAAVKDATNTGIKTAGIDVRICDVSAVIQEAMESYEIEIGGKVFPIKPVRNLCAHDIKQYRIHGEKTIPFVKNVDQTKMEEGEIFAIETFGTTGRGFVKDDIGTYGYGLRYDAPSQVSLPLTSATRLYKTIRENFGSLVFCRRFLDHIGLDRYLAGLNCLVSNGVLEHYQPLVDVKGSYAAQFEHTILLRESCKEVVSRGFDY